MEDIEFLKKYDNNDLKHAIKSLTGVEVSDDFISILQKKIANNEESIDFDEFREAFSQITKSLYPNGVMGASTSESRNGEILIPLSPPPTPQRSRSNSCSSSISQLSDLPSPPNSPRNSDSDNSFSPFSFSPLSSSPPKFIYAMSTSPSYTNNSNSGTSPPKPTYYSTTSNIFSKPPPPQSSSPRRPRSSSVRTSQPLNIIKEPLNDDQNITLMNSHSSFNSPSDKNKQTNNHNKPPIPSQPMHLKSNHSHNHNNHNHNNHNNSHTNNNMQSSQLFKSLLSMDEGYSDAKKSKVNKSYQKKSSPVLSDSEDNNHHNENQFSMDIDWSKHLNTSKKKTKFTYRIDDSDNSDHSNSDSDKEIHQDFNNNLYFQFNENQIKKQHGKKKSSSKKSTKSSSSSNKYSDDEIEWATEEFYYDPSLDNSEDLHQIISILKEKYSLYSNKSNELEKKVTTALKTNNQLEDDLDEIKKDCITLSLSNQALKKNNQILESSLEYHSSNSAQIKIGYLNLEKENILLKKRLQSIEDQAERSQKQIDVEKQVQQEKDERYKNQINILNTQYSNTIESIRKEYQKEFELEYRRNKEILISSEQKLKDIQRENQQLHNLLLESNRNLESLEKLYQDKIQEYQSHQDEKQSQTISQEILSTENQKLKKQIKKSEMLKILELKNEIKRTKKEHLHYKSLLLQGIDDFKTIESSINNKFK